MFQSQLQRSPRRIRPPKRTDPKKEEAWRRLKRAGVGLVLTVLIVDAVLYFNVFDAPIERKKKGEKNGVQLDGPLGLDVAKTQHAEEEKGLVETGTSHVPTFPRFIKLGSLDASSDASYVDQGEQDYQLIGLGIRTVSFLSIQVYVVGMYIAVADIERLQERLVRIMDPVATTLVPGEKAKLKEALLDPEKGEEIWGSILKDAGIRTALRIVPTRNTDFMHLRDGWINGITTRSRKSTSHGSKEFEDDAFGQAVTDFKGIWGGGGRKSVPKQETLLLTRDARGTLEAWLINKAEESSKIGTVSEERISRLIWLGYLAGKTVSSEGARQSIVNGVMDYVERPVGTVATQVV